ncbi:MAG: DUF3391 domain-containing protein [Granulosicoccaceae bacterium]
MHERRFFTNKEIHAPVNKADLDCIPVIGLTIGMEVILLDKPWEESRFSSRGFTIKTLHDIEQLREECQKVYISRGEDAAGMFIAGNQPKGHNWG